LALYAATVAKGDVLMLTSKLPLVRSRAVNVSKDPFTTLTASTRTTVGLRVGWCALRVWQPCTYNTISTGTSLRIRPRRQIRSLRVDNSSLKPTVVRVDAVNVVNRSLEAFTAVDRHEWEFGLMA